MTCARSADRGPRRDEKVPRGGTLIIFVGTRISDRAGPHWRPCWRLPGALARAERTFTEFEDLHRGRRIAEVDMSTCPYV